MEIEFLKNKNSRPNSSDVWSAFHWTVSTRRAVRHFTSQKVPHQVIEQSLQAALLAPSASNLQPWEFFWIQSEEKIKIMRTYCLNLPSAQTASDFIVCVARCNIWKKRRDWFLKFYANLNMTLPPPFDIYYQKIVPLSYMLGPLSLIGFIKRIIFSTVRLFQPFSDVAYTKNDIVMSAVKNTALACQNLMLAIRAQGYDSCPMDGYDPVRVRRLLKLSSDSKIVMVIAVGERHQDDVKFGPPVRCESSEMIHIV